MRSIRRRPNRRLRCASDPTGSRPARHLGGASGPAVIRDGRPCPERRRAGRSRVPVLPADRPSVHGHEVTGPEEVESHDEMQVRGDPGLCGERPLRDRRAGLIRPWAVSAFLGTTERSGLDASVVPASGVVIGRLRGRCRGGQSRSSTTAWTAGRVADVGVKGQVDRYRKRGRRAEPCRQPGLRRPDSACPFDAHMPPGGARIGHRGGRSPSRSPSPWTGTVDDIGDGECARSRRHSRVLAADRHGDLI